MELAHLIEATLLRPDHIENDVRLLCMAARDHDFVAVCVPPVWARFAVTALAGSRVQVCATVGYPLGTHTASVKALEARLALEEGAAEVLVVPNLSAYKSGYRLNFRNELTYVVKQARMVRPEVLVKVLLYADLLSLAEQREVVRLVQESGGKFLLVSRDDGRPAGASEVRRVREFAATGVEIGVLGPYRSAAEVQPLVEVGIGRLATPWGVEVVG